MNNHGKRRRPKSRRRGGITGTDYLLPKARRRGGITGTVYLLCFAPGIRRGPGAFSSHYLGWTARTAEERLDDHLTGRGSPLVYAAGRRGLDPTVVETWVGTRHDERALKNTHNLPRFCPRCGASRIGARRGRAQDSSTGGTMVNPSLTNAEPGTAAA